MMHDAYRMTASGTSNTLTDRRNGGPYHFGFDFDIDVNADIPAMEEFVLAELEKHGLQDPKVYVRDALKREVEKLDSPDFIAEQISTTVREARVCVDWPGPCLDGCSCVTTLCGCVAR